MQATAPVVDEAAPQLRGLFFNARDKLAFAIAAGVTFVGYLCTLAPSVTLEDSGEFLTAAHHLGVPHPPGYPFYVALLKALALIIPSAKYVQLAAGTIGSLAALWLVRKLGALMFGAAAGWLAVAILILQPSFWLAGIGNQVRTFLAAGGVAVALCVWRAWHSFSA